MSKCFKLDGSKYCEGLGSYSIKTTNDFSDPGALDRYIQSQILNKDKIATEFNRYGCNGDLASRDAGRLRYLAGKFCTQQIYDAWDSCGDSLIAPQQWQQAQLSAQSSSTESLQSRLDATEKTVRAELMTSGQIRRFGKRQVVNDNGQIRYQIPFYLNRNPMVCQSSCVQGKYSYFAFFQNSTICELNPSAEANNARNALLSDYDRLCINVAEGSNCIQGTGFERTTCGFPDFNAARSYCSSSNVNDKCCSQLQQPSINPLPPTNGGQLGQPRLEMPWLAVVIAACALFVVVLLGLGALTVYRRRRKNRNRDKYGSNATSATSISVNSSAAAPNAYNSGSGSASLSNSSAAVGAAAVGAGAAGIGAAAAASSSRGKRNSRTSSKDNTGSNWTTLTAVSRFLSSKRNSEKSLRDSSHSSRAVTALAARNAAGVLTVPEHAEIIEATHMYVPTLADELPMDIGDKILVIKRFDDGWAVGRKLTNNQEGAFPLVCTNGAGPITVPVPPPAAMTRDVTATTTTVTTVTQQVVSTSENGGNNDMSPVELPPAAEGSTNA